MDIKKQIRKLLALEGLWSFRLGGSIWVLLLGLRGFSLAEIGLVEGIFHLVSICGEIPSGLCADLLGRRRTMVASQAIFVLSALLMACSTGMAGVLSSMALQALGHNLASGTREALSYDSLLQAGREGDFMSLSSWQNIIYRLGAALATLCAGASILLGYRVCYVVDAAFSLAGVCVALSLAEPVVTAGQREREAHVLTGLGARMVDYVKETVRFLRTNPRAVGLMLFNALVGACATLLGFYLQDALPAAGAPAALLGPLLLAVSLGGAVGSRCAGLLARLRYSRAAALCCAVIAGGCLLTGSRLFPLMALGGFLAAAADDGIQIVCDTRLNDAFPSDQRSTLVSVSSICFSLVMAALSPLLGLAVGSC